MQGRAIIWTFDVSVPLLLKVGLAYLLKSMVLDLKKFKCIMGLFVWNHSLFGKIPNLGENGSRLDLLPGSSIGFMFRWMDM